MSLFADEDIAQVNAAVNKIGAAATGMDRKIALLALLAYAVSVWRKTGLPIEDVHETIDTLVLANVRAHPN